MNHSHVEVAVFVEIDTDADASQVESDMRVVGLSVQSRVGRTYIGVIRPEALDALENTSGVRLVERSHRLRHHLDHQE